jgi:hypothetical protein
MTVQEAAAEVTRMLSDPLVFRTVESPVGDPSILILLAPDVQRLFGRYDRIELVKAPYAVLDRSAVGPARYHEKFLRIGLVEPGTDIEGEIGVLPGDARIYELHPNEGPDPMFGTSKSIFHWLLAVAEATSGDRWTSSSSLLIYIVGLIPVAFGQSWLRVNIGNLLAFLVIVACLFAIRLLAEKRGTNGRHSNGVGPPL